MQSYVIDGITQGGARRLNSSIDAGGGPAKLLRDWLQMIETIEGFDNCLPIRWLYNVTTVLVALQRDTAGQESRAERYRNEK